MFQARDELNAGNPAAALKTCDQMAKQYPGGQHAQEREYIAIQALAMGNRSAARSRAEAFLKAWPTSTLVPKVKEYTR